jgi:enoyl-[acyl-carrier protein] reductase III
VSDEVGDDVIAPGGLGGRRFLVTGGTRGIGAAITRRLCADGATVIANYARNDAAAEALAAALTAEGQSVVLCRADVSRPGGLVQLGQALGEGPLAGVVHAAATGVHGPITALDGRHWDFTFALNARAFLEIVNLCLPRLQAGARIVGLSSEGAVHAVPQYTLVGASKAALESLCRHLAVELGGRGIRVNALSAGEVLTDAWEALPDAEARLRAARARHPQGRLTTVEEVAAAAHFLCSDASSGISGHTLVVDGGARVRGGVV